MKIVYALMAALMMTFASSCTGNNAGSANGEDSVKASETENIEALADNDSADAVPDGSAAAEADDAVLTQMVNNGKPSVVDFSATWCGPCQKMKPVFHKLAAEFADKYNFVTIDIDENPGLAEKYHIQVVPTFIFIDADGEEGDRISGAVEESELRDKLQNPAWF